MDKELFEVMIDDFISESEEMDDFVVDYDSIHYDDDLKTWVAEAKDKKCAYTLYAHDGDVIIEYDGAL